MKTKLIILMWICISYKSSGQIVASSAELTGNYGNFLNSVTFGKPIPPGEVIGTNYLNRDWQKGTINLLNNQVISNCDLKYDVLNKQVEVFDRKQNLVYIIDNKKIVNFTVTNYIKDINFIKYDNEYYEVLTEGTMSVWKKYYIYTKQPTYVVGLDAGSRDYKMFLKHDNYIKIGEKLIKVDKNLVWDRFINGEKLKKLEEKIKSEKLKAKNEESLIKIANFYNTL
jgi:hypothetical protein